MGEWASFSLSSFVKARAVREGAKDITKQEELFGEFSLSTEATVVVTELLNIKRRVAGAFGYAAVNDCGELKVLSPTPHPPFPCEMFRQGGGCLNQPVTDHCNF